MRFLGKLLLVVLILLLCLPLLLAGVAIVARMMACATPSFALGWTWSTVAIRGGVILVPGLVLLVVLIAVLAKARPAGQADANGTDGRVSQQIYQGLARLEERVEALETILLDHTARAKDTGPRRNV